MEPLLRRTSLRQTRLLTRNSAEDKGSEYPYCPLSLHRACAECWNESQKKLWNFREAFSREKNDQEKEKWPQDQLKGWKKNLREKEVFPPFFSSLYFFGPRVVPETSFISHFLGPRLPFHVNIFPRFPEYYIFNWQKSCSRWNSKDKLGTGSRGPTS